jgi:hypothetical protein
VFEPFIASSWAGALLWLSLYVSDYYLTILCARLYRAQDKISFEGSFEITPIFQADVNALRPVSPRFVFFLVASTAYLLLLRRIAGPGSGLIGLYQLVLGGLVLVEAIVHVRHVRNWYLFGRTVGLLKGHMEYPRGIMLRNSALEFFVFSALYASLFLVTGSLFVLGGAIGCCVLSINHYRLATRHEAAVKRAAAQGTK